ncbi:hypothetical protein [Paraburkholderia atlantica]|uniref:hypothetical protein n=1 Tax=Paraburkholderia atlantica TaxID=2654982 RepID=UPI001859669B|nr:hypothetical protein [Paraburkholderia atlantica]MBB5508168.1 hypothetical protein [Paraburkholderia atlantica]
MRRVETYVGQQVYEWLFSAQAQYTMTSIAKVCAALFGTSGVVANGLACTPTSPASMAVQIGPGELYQTAPLEATACGTLPADTAHTLLKQGVRLDTYTTPTFAAPATSGQSINYLIEAQYQDSDISLDPTSGVSPVVLQYYNAASPSTPWSGPNDSGASSNTFRDGIVAYQIKAGSAATSGSQATPSPDTGWIGLWAVTVAFGQTSITSANIAPYNGAPVLASPILTQVQQAPAIVGASRNLSMSVTAASASASLTADEIVVESALGGNTYKLSSFAKVINLATTGAGGMDTGAAPASGYVALYAIYNPTTGASALLATNATSTVAPNVYGGANMPAGYTASALVSVLRTNASSQFVPFCQNDRLVSVASANVLNSTASQATYASLSIASAIPKNAKTWSGTGSANCNAAGSTINSLNLSADGVNEIGSMVISNSASVANQGNFSPISNFPVLTPQTVFYKNISSTGTPVSLLYVSGYTF